MVEAKNIGTLLGFSITMNLGKYLGIRLLYSLVSKDTYQDIVDKMERQLSRWNALYLSLAGRIALAQSMFQVVFIDTMQTTSLLLGVKAKIDQACKKFTWGEASRQQDKYG